MYENIYTFRSLVWNVRITKSKTWSIEFMYIYDILGFPEVNIKIICPSLYGSSRRRLGYNFMANERDLLPMPITVYKPSIFSWIGSPSLNILCCWGWDFLILHGNSYIIFTIWDTFRDCLQIIPVLTMGTGESECTILTWSTLSIVQTSLYWIIILYSLQIRWFGIISKRFL